MRSHRCEFKSVDLLKWVGGPLAAVLTLAALIRLGAAMGALPDPRPALDVDRSILIHQADASRRETGAEILIIGDSSALMNVDAAAFSRLSEMKTLNLGTLSFLSMDSFAMLLREYLKVNPPPKRIVLLVHPEFLRRSQPSAAHVAALERYLANEDHVFQSTKAGRILSAMGVNIIEGRWRARLPVSLPDEFGRHYGFTTQLMNYMTEHGGSAADPRGLADEDLRGTSEYYVSSSHNRGVETFRLAVPVESELFVGLTPIPQSLADPGYDALAKELLDEWRMKLGAGTALTGLPAVLPDNHFASRAHLRPEITVDYTASLWNAMDHE